MQVVPLQPVASQSLQVQLDGQDCAINVYQKAFPTPTGGIYLDLYVSGVLIIGGAFCENLNRLVRDLYLGFSGDLCFFDTQGTSDPVYTGLGSQYVLIYLEPQDLPAGQG